MSGEPRISWRRRIARWSRTAAILILHSTSLASAQSFVDVTSSALPGIADAPGAVGAPPDPTGGGAV
ncbi:hypothetical protein K2Z84_02165, partial [Candidatus Binatia bacterium]|nr:hypothetical protein [Candidatus Binatia bacterium]